MASQNLYHRRLVAESSGKACWICYKPSSTVLITPESDDWFHVCPGHLTDRKFAIAKDEEDLAKKKREEDLEKEIEAVKKDYEEKLRKKAEKRKAKDKDKEKDKDAEKDKRKDEQKEDEKDEKEKEEKLKELEEKKDPAKATVDGPRIFELQKNFYQMRLQKKRDAEIAKRNRDRLRAPGAFPSVPTGNP
jgi:hypothetical protein